MAGTWTYQWNLAGVAIPGATGPSYIPLAADVGMILTVSVTAANTGGSSPPATSEPTLTTNLDMAIGTIPLVA